MLRRLRPVTRFAAICLGLFLILGPLLLFGSVGWKVGAEFSPEAFGGLLLLFIVAAPMGAVLLASAAANLDCVELFLAPVPTTYGPLRYVVGGDVAEEMAADEPLMQDIRRSATTNWGSHVLYRRILLARIGRLTLTLDNLTATARDEATGLREERLRVAALLAAAHEELLRLPKWRRSGGTDV